MNVVEILFRRIEQHQRMRSELVNGARKAEPIEPPAPVMRTDLPR